jgi:hypothetical protein
MPTAGRRTVGAVVRALDTALGHIAGHGRHDVADPYLIRVSARGWADLGETPPSSEPPTAAAERHGIVRKLYEDFSEPARINSGTKLQAVDDPGVFRIKSEGWRAAVRYNADDGVVWLCRALSLARFHAENDAYREFGALHDRGQLLPSEEERRFARGDQFVVGAIAVLRQARVDADNDPFNWHGAEVPRPDGTMHFAGRVYAERELIEQQGEYVTRFLLLVRRAPDDVELRDQWEQLVASQVLTSGEKISDAYDLPGGTNRRSDELPLMQEAVELLDEEELRDLGADAY